MNPAIHSNAKPNRFFKALGANSWNDAAMCLLGYAFLIWVAIWFFLVIGAFLASFVAVVGPTGD